MAGAAVGGGARLKGEDHPMQRGRCELTEAVMPELRRQVRSSGNDTQHRCLPRYLRSFVCSFRLL